MPLQQHLLEFLLYVGAEKDTDGDGVEDNKDVCPSYTNRFKS